MRILMVTNKVKTYALGFKNILDPLRKLGHQVVWAADFSNYIGDKSIIPCIIEHIDIKTNPFDKHNINAYKRLLEIIDSYDIQAVMCSTPIGSALARLAAKRKKISPVLYEAHGFLFFKGAPLINNTLFKLEELILAHYTDTLITITQEDYNSAQSFKLRGGGSPYIVHGAGVKVGVTVSVDKNEKRKSIEVPTDAFMIVSAGELNKNKNVKVMVKALSLLPNVHYVACGVGPEKENLIELAQNLGVSSRFHLLGYRTDMQEIMSVSDAFVMTSYREGMPRALLEAMDLGLACVGSDTRGIRDLIDEKGGFICSPNDYKAFAKAFTTLIKDDKLRFKMGGYNKDKVKIYSDQVVKNELLQIYEETFGNDSINSL